MDWVKDRMVDKKSRIAYAFTQPVDPEFWRHSLLQEELLSDT